MRYPELTDRQRMQVAEISGTIQRITHGIDQNRPHDWKTAELRSISIDPTVYGHVLGHIRASADELSPIYLQCEPLLIEMGADEAAAQRALEWRRWDRERRHRVLGQPIL